MPINSPLAQYLIALAAYNAAQNTGLAAIVAKETIQYFDCVAINIDATHNYYFTQAPFNLTLSDGNSYQAAGGLLQVTDFVDNASFSIEQLEIQLAGIVTLPTGETVLKTVQENIFYPIQI